MYISSISCETNIYKYLHFIDQKFFRIYIYIYIYIYTVIVRVFAAPFSPNFMSKSRGASYTCISSFKPFYPHKISRQNQDTA